LLRGRRAGGERESGRGSEQEMFHELVPPARVVALTRATCIKFATNGG
jgi:hypothetical protein